jgi:fructosamine-3-kinase
MALDIETAAAIARTIGLDEHGLRVDTVPGGDIAEASVLSASDATVFVKTLPLAQAGLLSAEQDGLEALAKAGSVRTPRVIQRGMIDGIAWLALEYLNLDARDARVDAALGSQLAALHRHGNEEFGWHRNNYIGRTPQSNTRDSDWTTFFAIQRLDRQFDRLRRAHPDSGWHDLKHLILEAWDAVSADHHPEPSLIHGDLWRGNAAAMAEGVPVIFDPAVHYADRECDLAMAHLFGGFDDAFYERYQAEWPLPEGFEERRLFYKLYHMLNHANLFGGPYVDASEQLCRRILKH